MKDISLVQSHLLLPKSDTILFFYPLRGFENFVFVWSAQTDRQYYYSFTFGPAHWKTHFSCQPGSLHIKKKNSLVICRPGPLENSFLFCRQGSLKKINRPSFLSPASWKNHFSFAGPVRSLSWNPTTKKSASSFIRTQFILNDSWKRIKNFPIRLPIKKQFKLREKWSTSAYSLLCLLVVFSDTVLVMENHDN